jgi:glycosyltransferase involved in cell wall biosynthesis
MRVAVDCRYLRERASGIGGYVEALVDRLPQLAPTDSFDFWAHRLARRPLSPAPNVSETRVHAEPNSLWPILAPRRYASFEGVDLFHGPHNILPQRLPCPSVVTMHDVLPLEHPQLSFVRWSQRLKRIYYVQAQWRALREATRLIVTTSAMADRLENLCPGVHRRVHIVSHGVDDHFRPPGDPAAARLRAAALTGSPAPYFLVVGQFAPNKRHGLALAAFAQHVPKPWRLIFVQRQTQTFPLQHEAASLGVKDRVSWFPEVQIEHLIALYQGADGLVQPSIYEGFGLPLIEAMACGCPVVATDIPMFRDVLGGAGLLVTGDGADAFGRALASLAKSEPWRADLRAAGFERARGFSWDRCAQQTLGVMRKAAGVRSAETAITARPRELAPF